MKHSWNSNNNNTSPAHLFPKVKLSVKVQMWTLKVLSMLQCNWTTICLTVCMLGNFPCLCCSLLTFFLKKFFQEHYQSIKQFGSRSGPAFCRSWSGPKMFAQEVISRGQKSPLARKVLIPKCWTIDEESTLAGVVSGWTNGFVVVSFHTSLK